MTNHPINWVLKDKRDERRKLILNKTGVLNPTREKKKIVQLESGIFRY